MPLKSLDWMYHRTSCDTCARAQEFLTRKKIRVNTIVDARKQRMPRSEAIKLASNINEIYATKHRKVLHIDLKHSKPNDNVLADILLGPTGNLRAPALKVGSTLVVGFDEQLYDNLFSGKKMS